jgi:hypothetical protein
MRNCSKNSKPQRLGYDPDPFWAKLQMKELVRTLNGPRIRIRIPRPGGLTVVRRKRLEFSGMEQELRRLVEKWAASGPNLRKLFRQEPELVHRTKDGTTIFYATRSGRGHLDWSPLTQRPHPSEFESTPISPRDEALKHFMILISNPEWTLLAGPCKRCGDYFLKKTARKRVYCSKTCGATATAVPSITRKRQQERAAKIANAQERIDRYQFTKSWPDWKRWVASDTQFTLHWLSQALRRGFIQPPSQGSLSVGTLGSVALK